MTFERPPSEMTPQELLDEALLVSEQQAQVFYTATRKQQLGQRLNSLLFEISWQHGGYSAFSDVDESVSQ